jgi:hypothetical protein
LILVETGDRLSCEFPAWEPARSLPVVAVAWRLQGGPGLGGTRLVVVSWTPSGWATKGAGSAGRRRIAITMARSSGNAFFANFSTYDAPFPTKVRLALANNWRKVRTRSDCCGTYGQPGC